MIKQKEIHLCLNVRNTVNVVNWGTEHMNNACKALFARREYFKITIITIASNTGSCVASLSVKKEINAQVAIVT